MPKPSSGVTRNLAAERFRRFADDPTVVLGCRRIAQRLVVQIAAVGIRVDPIPEGFERYPHIHGDAGALACRASRRRQRELHVEAYEAVRVKILDVERTDRPP